MRITNIKWKNFSSYGNITQHIGLESNTGALYLVSGENGAGKSTISDVIKYSLYGKVDGKKLCDLVNRINGNLEVEIHIEKTTTLHYIIKRGISPNYLRIWKNGVEYDQAGKKNIQTYIEDEVLEMPYYLFNNIISLSINDFKSFISMNPGDKRQILDRIFGLEILNNVKELIKTKTNSIKQELSILTGSINKHIGIVEQMQAKINTSLKIIQSDNNNKIDQVKEILLCLENDITTQTNHYNNCIEKDLSCKNVLQTLKTEIQNCKWKRSDIDKKIDLYENSNCPTCGSYFNTPDHAELRNSLQLETIALDNTINDLEKKLIGFTEKYNRLVDNINIATSVVFETKNKIKQNKELINQLLNQQQDTQLQYITDLINQNNTELVILKENEKKNIVTHKFLSIIEDIFSDTGIKKMAIHKILPLLNIEIQKTLEQLFMDYLIVFNSECVPEISQLGYRIDQSQLSTGEKKKLDFAVLLGLIRLLKLKFQNINIIYLDEMFSSIDHNGVGYILRVLKNSCKELGLNMFVINHSILPVEMFDYNIHIEKTNSFSSMKLEKIK